MRLLYLFAALLLGSCAHEPCFAGVPHGTKLTSTKTVTATGYSWREPAHHAYGRHNCQGGMLDDTQVAADLRFYPLGTVLWIEGLGRRVVTDRGSAILGPRHIDIHFTSLRAMRAWGTRLVHIRVIGRDS